MRKMIPFCFKRYLAVSVALTGLLPITSYADSLLAVMQRSIRTNPNVLSYKESRLSIDQAVNQAKAGYYPTVTVTAAYGPQTSTNSNTISNAQQGSASTVTMPVTRAGVLVRENVFSGFETTGEVARNKARANSAAYQLLASIHDTAHNVAQFYLEVLQEEELVRLARENLAAHRKIRHMIRLRSRAGLANESDYIQTQGRVALAESQLSAELNNLNDSIARYKRVTGEYPDGLFIPHQIHSSFLPRSEREAIAAAVANYPIVKSARSDITQACEQHEVAKATNYPRIDVVADLNRNRNEGGLRGPSYDQAIFLQASYDVYAGGAHVARQKETAYLFDQAKEIMHNSVRQAKENAKIAWNFYETSRRVLPMLKHHRDSSVNTVSAYGSQYKLGKRTLFDLLDVQSELYNARREYQIGRFKLLTSQYRLLHSTGTLIQAMHLTLPDEINTVKI